MMQAGSHTVRFAAFKSRQTTILHRSLLPPPPSTTTTLANKDSANIANADPIDDFEQCFSSLLILSVHILGVDDSDPVSVETIFSCNRRQ